MSNDENRDQQPELKLIKQEAKLENEESVNLDIH